MSLHPMPEPRWRGNKSNPDTGYWHFPYVYRKADQQFKHLTSRDNFFSKFIRLVAGFRYGAWNRGPDSFITENSFSVGPAHAPRSGYIEDLADWIRDGNEGLASWAWGARRAELLKNPYHLKTLIPAQGTFDTRDRWQESWNWFVEGFYEIARHPDMIRFHLGELVDKVASAQQDMRKHAFTQESTLAALARISVSQGTSGSRKRLRAAISETNYPFSANEDEVMEYLYEKKYHASSGGELKRLELIRDEFGSSDYTREVPSTDDLNWEDMPIIRVDGTFPRFVLMDLENVDPDEWPPPEEAGVEVHLTSGEDWGTWTTIGLVLVALALLWRR